MIKKEKKKKEIERERVANYGGNLGYNENFNTFIVRE